MPKKKTTETFIIDAQKKHGNRYDYSKVTYVNSKTKVDIICVHHGIFCMTPNNHLKGQGCPKCGDISMANLRRKNISSFIELSQNKHGNRYDYSQVEYINSHTKVAIICPIHGLFQQLPNDHINGVGCPNCARDALSKNQRTSINAFIKKANLKHNFKYDYSLVKYSSLRDKVKIICPKHGIFAQSAKSHLNGHGCPRCYGNNHATRDDFISKARSIHGNKYDYSLVEYINSTTKIIINCTVHGLFEQKPQDHLSGYGCPVCGGSQKLTTKEFIKRAKETHGEKYDYSLVEYKNGKTKVKIICPKHGVFFQTPQLHILGSNCPKCVGKSKLTTIEFIEIARKIHGNKYDYSKVEYHSIDKKVSIICPVHGEFKQTARDHIYLKRGCIACSQPLRNINNERFITLAQAVHGNKYNYSKIDVSDAQSVTTIICPVHGEFYQNARIHIWHKSGCPICSSSHLEEDMRQWLTSLGIRFEEQKEFTWLVDKRKMKLDFFLPEFNIAIECQGYQHFKAVSIFGGNDGYLMTKHRDDLKRKLCHINGIKLLYYSNLGIDYPYQVFEDKNLLLQEITLLPNVNNN